MDDVFKHSILKLHKILFVFFQKQKHNQYEVYPTKTNI